MDVRRFCSCEFSSLLFVNSKVMARHRRLFYYLSAMTLVPFLLCPCIGWIIISYSTTSYSGVAGRSIKPQSKMMQEYFTIRYQICLYLL